MTYTEEFIPEDEQGFGQGDYPTAFGITFTPKVSGIALGLLGLLVSAYLLMNFGLSAFGELSELQAQEADKRQQVEAKESGKLDQEKLSLEAELRRLQLTKQQVLGLYSKPDTLNTILLDITRLAEAGKVELLSFQPAGETTVVNDGSLGTAVNGKLKRQSYQLQIDGTYQNIQTFLRNLERLQPLLVVKNLSISPQQTESQAGIPVKLVENPDEVYAIPGEPAKLGAQFTLDVVLPAQ